MKGKTGFGAFPRTPYIINVLPLLTYKSGFLVLFATQKWTKLQKKFFYVYVLYISRTYTLFHTFFWTRNRKISYTFYLYVLRIRFTYTFYVHIYVYVIVRENVYVAFLVLLWIFARLSLMTSIDSGFFWAEKFLAPQIPVKLEVKSRFSEYIKKASFDLLSRDWFSAYSDFKFRLKKFLIKTNICSIVSFKSEFDGAPSP